uniref:hypothetical protein n=1 Tax=Lactococcus garvieae TaxID=1363 RepID=UPI00359C37EE
MSEDKQDARKQLEINAKKKDIMEVAQAFGMTVNKAGNSYQGEFQGHNTFTIYPGTNSFLWHGRGLNNKMSVVDLVSVLKFGATTKEEIDAAFPKSVVELNRVELAEYVPGKIPEKKIFKYFYEESPDMELAINYLEHERGISRKTIDYCIDLGVIAQAEWRTELDDGSYFYEPVVIFKNLDSKGNVIGGSAQGIESHPEIPGHTHKSGHLKRVLPNSGSNSGLKISIGTPKNVVPIEAPIDLLSYLDLNQDTIQDTILVAADGYKPDAYWKAMGEVMLASPLVSEEMKKDKEWALKHLSEHPEQLRKNYQALISNSDDLTGQFIFAFDNDEQGQSFIEKFKNDNPDILEKIKIEVPNDAHDWNDQLKLNNQKSKDHNTPENTNPDNNIPFDEFGFIEPPPEFENMDYIPENSTPEETYQIPQRDNQIEDYSQTKFVKIYVTENDNKGKPTQVAKIFELNKLTNISDLKTDITGRVSLDVVNVLTLAKNNEFLQEAKYSVDKQLKNNRFVLSYNISKDSIERPTKDEIQKLNNYKGKFEQQDKQNNKAVHEQNSYNNKKYVKDKTSTADKTSTLSDALASKNVQGVNTFLNQELESYRSLEKYKSYLNVLSNMPELASKNIRLLVEQKPDVKMVKEFNTWSNDYKRKIIFKSKAIKMFIPSPQPSWDKNENMKLDEQGNPVISSVNEQLVSVFDISQTEDFVKGKQIDSDLVQEVSSSIPREKAIQYFQELSKLSTKSIHFTETAMEVDDKSIHFENSWYSKQREVLYIKKHLSPEKALQTLVQELAYQKYFNSELSPDLQKAEVLSMSYIMLRQIGLETDLQIPNVFSQMNAVEIENTLDGLQEKTNSFSKEFRSLRNPKKKNKMQEMSFKEKMELAKHKQQKQIKEKSSGKKVQGVPKVQVI